MTQEHRFRGKVVVVTGTYVFFFFLGPCPTSRAPSPHALTTNPNTTPTGGGAGIGAAICERFHAEGAKVYVVDVNENAANVTAAALTGKQADTTGAEDGQAPRAVAATVDISREALVSAFMDQVQATDGRLDVLVNNAARFVLKRQVA